MEGKNACVAFRGFSRIGWFKDAELLEAGNCDFVHTRAQGRRNSD